MALANPATRRRETGYALAMPPRSPPRSKPLLALEDFLPYRLSVLTNRVSGRIARAYQRRFGLSIWEWRVMAVLGRHPGASAGEVVERTAMDKVTVSRAVAALIRKGLIARKAHEGDKRRAVLRLAPKGRSVYGEIVPLALAKERLLLAALSAAERRALDALLEKLAKAAEKL